MLGFIRSANHKAHTYAYPADVKDTSCGEGTNLVQGRAHGSATHSLLLCSAYQVGLMMQPSLQENPVSHGNCLDDPR